MTVDASTTSSRRFPNLQDARHMIAADAGGEPAAYVLRHGTMRIGLYAPRLRDDQTPHTQDELYVVTAGTAILVHDGDRRACGLGDVLFVAAGAPHLFEGMSKDFEVCVVFWGAEGGEEPRPADELREDRPG